MGDNMVCSVCKGGAKGPAKVYSCYYCKKNYHTACGFLKTIQQRGSAAAIKQCKICLNEEQAQLNLSMRQSSDSSRQRTVSLNCSDEANNKQTEHLTDQETLRLILGKLGGLDEVKARLTSIEESVSKVDSIEAELRGWSEKLKVLEELPALTVRVTATEAGLEEVKAEQQALRQMFEQSKSEGGALINPLVQERLSSLEKSQLKLSKSNEELTSRLSVMSTPAESVAATSFSRNRRSVSSRLTNTFPRISTSSASFNSQIIMGNLTVPDGVDPKALTFAVLRTLMPDIDVRDLIAARLLVSKKVSPLSSDVSASAISGTNNASVEVVPSMLPYDSSSETHSAPAPTSARPPPIMVTLSNRPLALEILRKKVEHGKLHTSQIVSNLPSTIEPDLIVPNLINVNEFLPREVFNLHRVVRQRAKEPESGFIVFVRDGNLYARKKRGNAVSLISSIEDLDNFLL